MRKFIMKEGKGVRYGYFEEGITYNEDHKGSASTRLIDIVEEYPEDWEEVFDDQEQLKNNDMRKWKFTEPTNEGYCWRVNPVPNETYTEDEIQKMYGDGWEGWDYHRLDEDWEEVIEQKSPEKYYQGDKNILSISGTFGDVVFSLSGNFEKCLTVLDFISTLEVEKK